jgi:hypothetical protein
MFQGLEDPLFGCIRQHSATDGTSRSSIIRATENWQATGRRFSRTALKT